MKEEADNRVWLAEKRSREAKSAVYGQLCSGHGVLQVAVGVM